MVSSLRCPSSHPGTIKNVVARFVHEGSPVFACLLDAFRITRFSSRDYFIETCPLSWYKDQRMCIRWADSFSNSFPVSKGVRQYSRLFQSYCMSHLYSLLLRFSRSPSSCCSVQIFFCGQLLQFSDTVTHLGHQLSYNLSDSQDTLLRMRDMVRKANCLFAAFPRVGPLYSLACFNLTVCLSRAHLSGPSPVLLFTIWRLPTTRFYWRLPNRSHTGIDHPVARLDSLFNLAPMHLHTRTNTSSPKACPSHPIHAPLHIYSTQICCTVSMILHKTLGPN